MITEAAGEYLCDVLEQADVPQEAAIRFELQGDALVSKVDKPRPGDATFDHEGRPVVVMDDRVSRMLAESKLELQPTPEGEKLVLVH